MKTKMIRAAIAAVAATAAIPMSANADTIETNGVTWTYSVNNATAKTVTLGNGSSACIATTTSIDASLIPWTFTVGEGDDAIEYTVTTIGSKAFQSCKALTGTLTIPDSVTTIGERAFESCSGLTGLSGGNGVTRYYSYVFNNDSTMAGNYPDLSKVTSFGNGTFQYCESLTGHVTLCPTLTTIPTRLFNRNSITSIDIPPSVTSIGVSNGGESVFRESKKLKAICVPGAATGTTINPTALFQKSSVLKTVLFGPTTKCSSGNLATGSMLTSVSGCTVIVPRSGWDGLVTGGSSNTIVYYGPNDDFDLSLDASAKVITAVPNNGDGLVAALDFADTFKTELGYDTKITVTNAIDLTGVTITEAMVADVTFNRLWFAVKTQAQLDGILDAFPAATEMAIDPTGLTEKLTVPAGRKIFVQAGGTYEVKRLKNGFVLIVK